MGRAGSAIAMVPVYTWKLLTDHLAAALTGRRWLAEGYRPVGPIILLTSIGAVGWYVEHLDLVPRHLRDRGLDPGGLSWS